jgi:hypothetical protein
MPDLTRDEIEAEFAAFLRRYGKVRNAFTASDVSAEFPYRSRMWVSQRLRDAFDGGRPIRGVTLTRHPREHHIYGVAYTSQEAS